MTRHLTALAIVMTAITAAPALANELQIGTATVARASTSGPIVVTASVAWKNAWRTARNHDAVWLFVKIRTKSAPAWVHGRLRSIAAPGAGVAASCQVSADRVGAFCAPAATHRGDVNWRATIEVESGRLPESDLAAGAFEARVFGVEMVYVPAGPFSIGDKDPKSVAFAAFYKSDAAGGHDGLFRIATEEAIRVAPEAGALYYQAKTPQYEGDRQGPVPAAFPKGTRAFYTMKYEVLQGQYAAFLDTIPVELTAGRTPASAPKYAAERGTIRQEDGRFIAGAPARPANWITWDDGTAFADWAGLRPMTELEYTKAVRGPDEPVAGDYPWGTASKDRLLRRMGPDDELVRSGAADESKVSDATRDVLGASFYWVMDLAGSVWERAVTIGHPKGRAFTGTHGDGQLGTNGLATNADWPLGDNEAGGYGYRGGGYYERGMPDREFNPYGPTEWRRYGSWGGAPRANAYGFRAVRTAER